MAEKFIAFLKNSVGYIMSTVFTAAYIALSILTIDKTGRTIGEIIGSGFVYYIFQIALTSLLRPQGITNGKNSAEYRKTAILHGEAVEKISDNMNELPIWCEKRNKENYRHQRTKILGGEALKYADYFDDDGNVIKSYEVDPVKMRLKWSNRFNRRDEKRKYKAYRRAIRLKLSELDPTSLTSSDKAKEDKYALPESEKEFLGRKFLKDIVWKALPAILFGLYGVKEVAQLSWAAFAWTVFQAFTGFASALAEMITSKHYIVNEVRTGMVKKIGWIDDFSSDLAKNPDEYKKRLKKETDNECVQKEKQDSTMAECVG